MDMFSLLRNRLIKWSEMVVEKLYIYVDDIKNIVLKQIEIQDIFGDDVEYDDVINNEYNTENDDLSENNDIPENDDVSENNDIPENDDIQE